jgi:hypothetical protein
MCNEKVHAYIIGLFYKYLKESFGGEGIAIFVKGAQRYAEQRGGRMAQRALRDHLPLDYQTYLAYGEWTSTIPHKSSEQIIDGDLVVTVSYCPWAETFAEMGLKECGIVYCNEIDRGIVRGFNPCLDFETESVIHNSDHCVMRYKGLKSGGPVKPPTDGKKDWQYHCAHVYTAIGELVNALGLGDIVKKVDADIAREYGEDLVKDIRNVRVNFNIFS